MIKTTPGEAAVYAYTQTSGSPFDLKVFTKLLIITFDQGGVTQEVEFKSEGTK